jgi:lambda family phage minor tail protein L
MHFDSPYKECNCFREKVNKEQSEFIINDMDNGQIQDPQKIAIRRDIAKSLFNLEPSAILEFYELYFDPLLEPFRFHSGTNNFKKDIIWRKNKYNATAIEVDGFESNLFGRLPRPKISVSNKDYLMSSILRANSDFRNAKFIRIKLFLKDLDSENFDDSINPFGEPDPSSYISIEKYLFSQKLIENKYLVQFELITPFDLQSLETASRTIHGRYCMWQYRGSGCNYQGDLVCQEDNSAFSFPPSNFLRHPVSKNLIDGLKYNDLAEKFSWNSNAKFYKAGEIVSLPNIDLNGFKDPSYTWYVCVRAHASSVSTIPSKATNFWEKDGCSKTLQACKRRYKSLKDDSLKYLITNDASAVNGILPFGGFPGTDKFRYE